MLVNAEDGERDDYDFLCIAKMQAEPGALGIFRQLYSC